MELDLHCTNAVRPDALYPLNGFLEEFSLLRQNLKGAFRAQRNLNYGRTSVINHVSNMKNFVLRTGACRVTELLAEYETSLLVCDYSTCRRLEKDILSELEVFREVRISLVC